MRRDRPRIAPAAALAGFVAGLAAFAIATTAPGAIAQSYPSRPVHLEVGAPAGGGTDIVARMLGDKLGESLKQPFVVDNRPGASNTIAADFTAKSAPESDAPFRDPVLPKSPLRPPATYTQFEHIWGPKDPAQAGAFKSRRRLSSLRAHHI